MTRIVTVANNKGGVAKTTTAYHLARAWAQTGSPVLLIDLDPQGNLSSMAHASGNYGSTATLFQADTGIPKLIQRPIADTPALSLIASAPVLEDVAAQLVLNNLGVFKLANILRDAGDLGEFIVIDTPPGFGVLTMSALIAAHTVIVPCQPEPSAIAGVAKVASMARDIKASLGRGPLLVGTVATMVEPTLVAHKEGIAILQEGQYAPLLGSIPKRKGVNAHDELGAAYADIAPTVREAILQERA